MRINFRFEELGLKLANGKKVLQGVTGAVSAGKMTAIMGPSGAGKTTAMNVLMGKVARTGGRLFINDQEEEMQKFRKIIGYVPQEDIMLRELTVRENVLHAARIKVPASWSATDVEAFVDDILAALNLSHVAHSPIGDENTRGVSGGQRKRVNIAMELAGIPLALFLDEPTSGLDSTAALDVAEIMSQLTTLGLTIVAVIHQPRIEIFEKFDDVLMIAPGGRTAYLGPAKAAKGYFQDLGFEFDVNYNAADILMDILSGKGVNRERNFTVDDLVAEWETRRAASSPTPTSTSTSTSTSDPFLTHSRSLLATRGAPFLRQLLYCHNRYVTQQQRAIGTMFLELFVAVFAGSLIGYALNGEEMFVGLWKEPYSRVGPSPEDETVSLYGMLTGLAVALSGAPAAVNVFSNEKPVFWRETASGHSRVAYYLGKTIAATYRVALSALHFTAIYYVLAKPLVGFGMQYLILLGMFFGVYGMSAAISTLVLRENAALLSVVIAMFAAVFCGYGPSITDAKNGGFLFVLQMSFNKWAAEAQYSESLTPYGQVYDIEFSRERYGYAIDDVTVDLSICFAIGVVWRVIAFVLLVITHRDKQN
ncbi:P-loop containing nucleoside triphosphate hydrolase protein [Blyttiomyces helicus]|uniref:P-loop containing nucleoside triphosphate hydrolase protein n=1 Tax=Blyttiomyces helicus TaxID=388810 RepID=A0A4P9WGG4_9FUNG|nr:P-loop containing nucleoside triphosphate hydrolase protein [Blyttiomyces helicus]|eukprot:RKO90120.1 P-loop containing nucleoside triphosphate hydrolase protein [Blyttiomyces helicus]